MAISKKMLVTLQPEDKEQKLQFRRFKLKWIRFLIVLYSFNAILCWVFFLINYLAHLDSGSLKYFMCASAGSASWVIVIAVSKYTDHFVYLLPGFRVITSTVILWVLMTQTRLDKCSYFEVSFFMFEDLYINYSFLVDILLMSASFKQTVFVYAPIYVVTHIFHAKLVIQTGDNASVMMKIGMTALIFATIFFIYYIVTLQELMRFLEQQASKVKEQQMTQVLNAQSDAILVIHETESLCCGIETMFCNSKSVELFGFDLQQASCEDLKQHGHPFKGVYKNDPNMNCSRESLSLQDLIKKQPAPQKTDHETYTIAKLEDEEEITLSVRRMNITFSDKQCLVLNLTDVTSVIKLEREKQKYMMMKKLNTSVHHEMIGPLKAQMNISKILQKQSASSESRHLAKLITFSSQMLLLHAQDLLDQQIIENGCFTPAFAPGCVKDAIKDIINLVKATATKSLEIELTDTRDDRTVYFDKQRLQQVVLNLLSNAVKFQRRGKIQVSQQFIIRGPNIFAEVSVRDSGVGISRVALQTIFEESSDHLDTSSQGRESISNRVGLKICKKICKQFDGDINVESILGLGSIFTFTMLVKPQTRVPFIVHEEINSSQESDENLQQDSKSIVGNSDEGCHVLNNMDQNNHRILSQASVLEDQSEQNIDLQGTIFSKDRMLISKLLSKFELGV